MRLGMTNKTPIASSSLVVIQCMRAGHRARAASMMFIAGWRRFPLELPRLSAEGSMHYVSVGRRR